MENTPASAGNTWRHEIENGGCIMVNLDQSIADAHMSRFLYFTT